MLQSMGSGTVRHDPVTSLSLFTFMHWRRKWQPTPVFLPGESQGEESLVGYCLWGRTESDTTVATQQQQQQQRVVEFHLLKRTPKNRTLFEKSVLSKEKNEIWKLLNQTKDKLKDSLNFW